MIKQIALFMSLVSVVLTASAESLFDENNFRPLTSDRKAFRIGDSVTVLITEVSKAESSADASTNQALEANGGFTKNDRTETGSFELGLGRNSAGSTQREGELRARISVDVIDTDENGRLYVTGKQRITVNGEAQLIKLSGWIREEDIAADNTILSSRVSEARIEYNGKGIVGDANERGFIHWFLTKIGII